MSGRLDTMLHVTKQFEETFLVSEPAVAEPFRWVGIYRLLNSPEMQFMEFTWFVQMVIETELDRVAEIYIEEDLAGYKNHFIGKLIEHNPDAANNHWLLNMIDLGFNNIFDAMGFNNE